MGTNELPEGKNAGLGRAGVSDQAEHQDEVEYREALGRLASKAGLPIEIFEQNILAELETRPFGPDCVTLDEIVAPHSLEQLPLERLQHIRGCPHCEEFVKAIEPRDGDDDRFAKRAIKTSQPLSSHGT